jgi:ubiquinone/menaquinone biosynthesis C-methylase UbiE
MGYAQGNAVALPFGDAQFDRVLCTGVLYHVRDWMAALWELHRVTRRHVPHGPPPGGQASLSCR